MARRVSSQAASISAIDAASKHGRQIPLTLAALALGLTGIEIRKAYGESASRMNGALQIMQVFEVSPPRQRATKNLCGVFVEFERAMRT
jgi:hypothetical protein